MELSNTEKPWLKSYPPTVPAEIDRPDFNSIGDFFRESCNKFSNKIALTSFNTQLTYQCLFEHAKNFAVWLQRYFKGKTGNHVAIMLPNCIQYYIVLFGIFLSGNIAINLNPLYTQKELLLELQDAEVDLVVVLTNFVDKIIQIQANTQIKTVILTQLGDFLGKWEGRRINFYLHYIKGMWPKQIFSDCFQLKDLLVLRKEETLLGYKITADKVAFLQYTGGTTGMPKAAKLSHGNMLSNLAQCQTWFGGQVKSGTERIIVALPLYHIFGLTACCLLGIGIGAENILISDPRDLRRFIKVLHSHKFSVFVGLNTLFKAILRHPNADQIDFSGLKLTVAGGMALEKAVVERWYQLSGNWISEGYGLTEASPVVSVNPWHTKQYHSGIGLPLPSTDVRILDENEQVLPLGETGELVVKGPQVMLGYWKDDKLTNATFTQDGWLKTGDMAMMDEEGYLYIVDRKKDMIIVSGFNVYPREVEDVLLSHPAVESAAVIAVSSETTGESIKAYVVLKPDSKMNKKRLISHCRESLTRYKIPRIIEFRKALPKSVLGKIDKKQLREEETK